jgi:hypothetical protein
VKGTVDQATFLRQMNAEISKIVIGQTMTTDDGASLAQGKVHQDVKEEVTDADVEELCESFQQGPARWLTEWNFPGAAVPILRRPSPEDEERGLQAAQGEGRHGQDHGRTPASSPTTSLAEQYPGWRRQARTRPAEPAAPTAIPLRPAPAAAGLRRGRRPRPPTRSTPSPSSWTGSR